MDHLVSYFSIIGCDQKKQIGKVLQRFPVEDRNHNPFPEGIELFCQPQGWYKKVLEDNIFQKHPTPTFYVSILTDINGERHYCACFTFYEYFDSCTTAEEKDFSEEVVLVEECQEIQNFNNKGTCYYLPKCLALVSRFPYFETFRNCLGLIYMVSLEFNLQTSLHLNVLEDVILESMVAKLLQIQIPKNDSIPFTFSLSKYDVQIIQPPACPNIPLSNCCVATLFKQIGIYNAIKLFIACLTDHKILFHSMSYQRLTDCGRALTCLLYPFKYNNVFIPILPASLTEILNTPTPFLIGIHTSLLEDIHIEIEDVIISDLDSGNLTVPETLISPLPQVLYRKTLHSLSYILNPGLEYADEAFPKEYSSPSPPSLLDKEIRAVFLSLQVELFSGYRSCLVLSRVLPQPHVTFDKNKFLRVKSFEGNCFMKRLFEGMSFLTFICERGTPYRYVDIFDKYIQNFACLRNSMSSSYQQQIKYLAVQLSQNESSGTSYQEKIPKFGTPLEGLLHANNDSSKKNISYFPNLKYEAFQQFFHHSFSSNQQTNCETKLNSSNELRSYLNSFYEDENSRNSTSQKRLVPFGEDFFCTHLESGGIIFPSYQKRVKTFKIFIEQLISDNLTEANKVFPSAIRMLSLPLFRKVLAHELSIKAKTISKSLLTDQQFEMLIALINEALKNDTVNDENGFAADILPLSSVFCRKLSNGMFQFIYNYIQDHGVWKELQFWQNCLYTDCQKHLISHYLAAGNNKDGKSKKCESDSKIILDLAFTQLKALENTKFCDNLMKEFSETEESIVYSLVIYFVNQMIYLCLPINKQTTFHKKADDDYVEKNNFGVGGEGESNVWELHEGFRKNFEGATSSQRSSYTHTMQFKKDNSLTNSSLSFLTASLNGSDSFDIESGFEEGAIIESNQINDDDYFPLKLNEKNEEEDPYVEIINNLKIFIMRFVDKVCAELKIKREHIHSLYQMIPGLISMQMEMLESISTQIQMLQPRTFQLEMEKPPLLMEFEKLVIPNGIPAYILNNPANESEIFGYLPARGFLFITNYRIIFKGQSCQTSICDYEVLFHIPIAAIFKCKKLEVNEHNLFMASDLTTQKEQLVSRAKLLGPNQDFALTARNTKFLIQIISSTFQLMHVLVDRNYEIPGQSSTLDWILNLIYSLRYPSPPSSNVESPFSFFLQFSPNKCPALRENVDIAVTKDDQLNYLNKGDAPHFMFTKKKFKSKTLRNIAKKTTNLMTVVVSAKKSSGNEIKNSCSVNSLKRLALGDKLLQDIHVNEAAACNGVSDEMHVKEWETGGEEILNGLSNVKSASNRGLGSTLEDYKRLRLILPEQLSPPDKSSFFSFININNNYELCQSYPSHLLLPNGLSHEEIFKLSKAFKRNRLPLITWQHPLTKALLIRGSSLNSTNNLIKYIKNKHLTLNIPSLVNSKIKANSRSVAPNHQIIISSHLKKYLRLLYTYVEICRYHPQSLQTSNNNEENIDVKHFNGTLGLNKILFNQMKTKSDKKIPHSKITCLNEISDSSFITKPSAFYYLTDKSHIKSIKLDLADKEEIKEIKFIPIIYPNIREVKNSFKKLIKACLAINTNTIDKASDTLITDDEESEQNELISCSQDCDKKYSFTATTNHLKYIYHKGLVSRQQTKSFLTILELTGWFQQLYNIFRICNVIVEIMNNMSSSVIIGLEDGFDITIQISSLVQVMMDPFYRTITGFKSLIEKDWFAFGHRFAKRHVTSSKYLQNEGFIPIFLQFLDLVYQLITLYPLQFEFNVYFISFIGYHSLSQRYVNFSFDCHKEKQAFLNYMQNTKDKIVPFDEMVYFDIWEHIQFVLTINPFLFKNCEYLTATRSSLPILNPIMTSLADLSVWPFYTSNSTMSGIQLANNYDIDCISAPLIDFNKSFNNSKNRVFIELFKYIKRMPELEIVERNICSDNNNYKRLADEIIKNYTFRIISSQIKYNTFGNIGFLLNKLPYPTDVYFETIKDLHSFTKVKYPNPQPCQICGEIIRGLNKSGYHCIKCDINVHEKCKSKMFAYGCSNTNELPMQRRNIPIITNSILLNGDGGVNHVNQDLSDILKHLEDDDCLARQNNNGESVEAKNERLLFISSNKSSDNSSINTSGVSTLSTKAGCDSSSNIAVDILARNNNRRTSQDSFCQTVPESEQTIISCLSGYLFKRCNGLSNNGSWKKRWFILNPSTKQLTYFDSKEDKICKGCIAFKDFIGIYSVYPQPAAHESEPDKIINSPYFQIETLKRNYTLAASDQFSACEWIRNIQNCFSTTTQRP